LNDINPDLKGQW